LNAEIFFQLVHSLLLSKDLIDKECEKGFLSGPYNIPPFKKYKVSPPGLAEGKYSKKKLLILDLSAPP
jgi:hypothetical protein